MKPTLIFFLILVWLTSCNEPTHLEKEKAQIQLPTKAGFVNGLSLAIYDTNNFKAVKMEYDLRGMNRNTYTKPNHLMRLVQELLPINLKKNKSADVKDFLAKSSFLVRPWVLDAENQAELIEEADTRYQEFVLDNKNNAYLNHFRRYGATVMLRDFRLLNVSTKREIELSKYYFNELLQAQSRNFGLYYHSIKKLLPYLTIAEKSRYTNQILELSKNATLNVNIILEQKTVKEEIAITHAMFEKMASRAKEEKERAYFLEKVNHVDSVFRKRMTDLVMTENEVNGLYIKKLMDL